MGNYIIHNGNLYSTDELYHYGVKGMKWGVRKTPERLGDKNASKRRRLPQSEQDRIIEDLQGRYIRFGPYKLRVRDMNTPRDKMRQAVQDWSEAQYAKIRDDYYSGKLSKKKADRKWDRLSEETEKMLKEIEERRYIYNRGKTAVNDSSLMGAQAHQQFVNQQHTQLAIQEANRTASLGLSGGTNPFMFG